MADLATTDVLEIADAAALLPAALRTALEREPGGRLLLGRINNARNSAVRRLAQEIERGKP